MKHTEKEMKEKKAQLTSKDAEAVAVEKELSLRKKELERIEASLGSIGYQDGQLEALQKVFTD